MALDMFMTANEHLLLMSNDDAYLLAKDTAEANAKNRTPDEALGDITDKIKTDSVPMEILLNERYSHIDNIKLVYDHFIEKMNSIRTHPLNSAS